MQQDDTEVGQGRSCPCLSKCTQSSYVLMRLKHWFSSLALAPSHPCNLLHAFHVSEHLDDAQDSERLEHTQGAEGPIV
jgi:hypothetical protein